MTSSHDLAADLRELPHPAPPPDLTVIVLARIAQVSTPVEPTPAVAARQPDWFTWISLGGLVAGLVVALLNLPPSTGVISLGRGGPMAGFADVSSAPMATVSLVTGLGIYLVSLFLPVRERR